MAEGGEVRPAGARVGAAALLLAASVLLSRVLGYAREAVLANRLGAGAEVDAYRAAFQIPDLLNYFLAGGALSIAFIPIYSRVRAERGEDAAARLFATVLGTMGGVALVATALLWWQADALVALQFPRFSEETRALTTRLTRIVLPAQLFFITGGIVRAVVMAHGRFGSQALAPVLYNAGIIAGGLLLGSRIGPEGFAWGALAGAFAGPFAAAVIEARRMGLRIGARFAPTEPELLRYLAVALPLMLGVTLLTVDEWFDRWFGALLAEGTVATLGYARQLMLVPVAVVGQALATAALPTLSRLHAEGRREELDELLLGTLRVALALALLGGAAMAVFSWPIVELLFHHGRFTLLAATQVAMLLSIFAFAVPAWVTQQVAVRAFFARGDTWRPMLLGTGVAAAMVPLYLAFGRRFGADGLALAGVLGMTANAVLTLVLARVLHGGPSLVALGSTAARIFAVCIVASALGFHAQPARAGDVGALIDLAVGGAVFGAVAALGIWLLGDAELKAYVAKALRRLARR